MVKTIDTSTTTGTVGTYSNSGGLYYDYQLFEVQR